MSHDSLIERKRILIFCNSCARFRKINKSADLREGCLCPTCGLNSRQRGILLAIQIIILKRIFHCRELKVVGVSDGEPLRKSLSKIFKDRYKNYEYHEEPRLDITKVDNKLVHSADIVICSEVLEHVPPPIDLAFEGLFSIIKLGGFAVISVPHMLTGQSHVEHYPILSNFEIQNSQDPKLIGFDQEGIYLEFTDLVFHGGAGSTLEYRVFSKDSLIENLTRVGFTQIKSLPNRRFFGVSWEPWSRVWIARKPY